MAGMWLREVSQPGDPAPGADLLRNSPPRDPDPAAHSLFRHFVEESAEGMGWTDLDGRIRYMNPSLCRMLGVDRPVEKLGQPVTQFYDEPTARRLTEEILPAVMRDGRWFGEMALRSSGGQAILTRHGLFLLRDAAGAPRWLANVVTDLTERKRTEDELCRHQAHLEELVAERALDLQRMNEELHQEVAERRRAEKRYREFIENAPVGMYVLDLESRFIYGNRKLEEISGYRTEEWTGRSYAPIVHPDDLPIAAGRIQQAKEGVRTRPSDAVRIFHASGETIWVSLTSENVYETENGQEKLVGFQTFVEDITERKRAEQDLRESEEKWRSFFRCCPLGIFSYRLHADGSLVCQDANDAASRVLGFDCRRLVGKRLQEAFPALRRTDVPERFTRAARDGTLWETEAFPYLEEEGGGLFKIVAFQTAPGEMACLFENVSERRRAEEERRKLQSQLHQWQRLEALGTLAGGIAHDFNNILAAMMGYCELAQLKLPPAGAARADLNRVLEAGHRARDLVRQILAFSRQTEQEQTPVEVRSVVAEALRLLRASMPATVEIRENLASDARVLGDPSQLHQVVMNLCTNADHAMREHGGTLAVELRDRTLDEHDAQQRPGLAPGPHLCLSVSDTGHGMPPEVLEHIFDPFYTTKDQAEGSGLGLSVVHGILKSHHGCIHAYSEPGRGSRFEVLLPVIREAGDPQPPRDTAVPTGSERILFVDDEPPIAQLAREVLESLGYRVTTRTDPREALELFSGGPGDFDLVITDLTMPRLTGDRLAARLLAIRPDLPVILCTGFSARVTEQAALAMGIRAFVMKPVVRRDLACTIRRVLDRGPAD